MTHLYFHLVTHLLRSEPVEYMRKLISLFPDQQIVVSGIIGAGAHPIPPQVRVLKGLEEILAFSKDSL